MSTPFVWVQLYYKGKDEPKGQPVEIEPIPKNVGALKAVVLPKLDPSELAEVFVYPPEAKPPFSEQTYIRGDKILKELIDELGNKNPPVCIGYDHPLIVVAPNPKQADDQSEHPQAHFRRLAESAGINVSEVVMKVVVKNFSSRMLSTDTPDQAADLYREASSIPRSMTQIELAEQHISIGQLFPDAGSSKAVVLEAFNNGSPCLLKVTDEESLNHEISVWEAIEACGGASDHHLVPLKKLLFQRQAGVQFGNLSGSYNDRGEFRGGILMQKYQSTLARCKIPLTEEVLLLYGNQLLTAITKMHECGYCHMDIKPSNVFLWQGSCLLGDYGGASRPGEKVREHTHAYYPYDAGEEAKEETDFLLLAVTLLEMFGCVTSPPGPMTKDEIKSKVASVRNKKVKEFLGQLVFGSLS